ncbi:MAG: hypothetical protein M1816_005313 [Peltula sp. TS41687]|nr:MAG: hypothetical protein M1816_005313 [Peltula sp. TS41687]
MSSSLFHIQSHVIPCQHIREYPQATSNRQEDVLRLAIKQYTPLSNVNPQPGDVTIIGAHANGFPKNARSQAQAHKEANINTSQELYEPLWDDLLQQSDHHGFKIRGIWIADVAHQGDSGVLNEQLIGNDPSWFDHSRDLLHMINHFRTQMVRPIVGIGHSMGGAQLAHLSHLHPRLLTTLVLLDPVIAFQPQPKNAHMPRASAARRDVWPTLHDAELAFRNNPFYRTWDDRVLNRWLAHGLRPLPTPLHPTPPSTSASGSGEAVTLKTTKHQEVFTFVRPVPAPTTTTTTTTTTNNDGTGTGTEGRPTDSGRPEPSATLRNLPSLRPGTLYVFGARSPINPAGPARDGMVDCTGTGTGTGADGGVTGKERRVGAVVVEEAGHLVPFEKVGECADAAAGWLAGETERWRRVEQEAFQRWRRRESREKCVMGEETWRALGVRGAGGGTGTGTGVGMQGRVRGRL